MSNKDGPVVLHRLQSACGHLNAVMRMVENRAPCEDILPQLYAVQCALHVAGHQLIKEDARRCVDRIRSSPTLWERDIALENLISLVQMKHYFNE